MRKRMIYILIPNLGSIHDYTTNFLDLESWIALTVMNYITIVEQRYELAVIEVRK